MYRRVGRFFPGREPDIVLELNKAFRQTSRQFTLIYTPTIGSEVSL